MSKLRVLWQLLPMPGANAMNELIKQSEDLCAGATAGPWSAIDDYDGPGGGRWRGMFANRANRLVFATLNWDAGMRTEDARFIEEARTLLPEITEELVTCVGERIEARVDLAACQAQLDRAASDPFPWMEFLDARARLIVHFRKQGKSWEQVAVQLSCEVDQVQRIHQSRTSSTRCAAT